MDDEFRCPVCGVYQDADGLIETDQDYDSYQGFLCAECGASLNLEWAEGGYGTVTVNLPFVCPKCGADEQALEDVEEEAGNEGITCDVCSASLHVSWSEWKVDDIEIMEIPELEFYCPNDGTILQIEDVSNESGEQEIECTGCHVQLHISWSNWEIEEIRLSR